MMKRCSVLLSILTLTCAWGQNGYQNVSNRRFDTIADGPMGGVVVDTDNAAQALGTVSRLHRSATRGAVRREPPAWFKLLQQRRMLPANQPYPVVPQTVVRRQAGRLVLPQKEAGRQLGTLGQDTNRLTFDFAVPEGDTLAKPWSATQQSQLTAYLQLIEPILLRIYGPPAYNNTIKIVHDPSLKSLHMATYDASSNQIRLELLYDVDSADATLTPLDDYDLYVLTFVVLKAYHDDAFFYYDAWEDGFARAAQLLVISEAKPSFGFLARDFNLMFSAYDLLNQPGLENPSFLGADAGTDATTMREALGTVRAYLAQAAWLKVIAERATFLADFNRAYYQALATNPGLSGHVPLLKSMVATLAPTVEGYNFQEWYARQYVLDTAVVPGAKLFVFNIPQKDFITGEPTNSLPMNVYHFQTTATDQQVPLTGTVTFKYTAYDGYDLTAAVQGATGDAAVTAKFGQAGNPAGIASAVPLFFNIAGDQQVQLQRIAVTATANGIERVVWFPNDAAADDNQIRYDLFGLVTNGFQGALKIHIEGKADDLTANVIQGAFRVKVPGGLPTPARATFTWTPDSSGGSANDAIQRNVMFLGIIGTGKDAANGDAVVILETPPETLKDISQDIPAGLGMVTIPAWAIRNNAATVLGVPFGELLLARADSAVTDFQPYRLGSIYRLWPDTPAFRPGYSYWLQAKSALKLAFKGVEADKARNFRQHYPPGWQQIGNPWTDLNLQVQSLRVQAVDGTADLSLADAQNRGLVSSAVFRYNRTKGGYEVMAPTGVLTPYEGFWINVLDSHGVSIIYPNNILSSRGGAARPTRRTSRALTGSDWQLGLVATANQQSDTSCFVGVAPGAAAGYSTRDVAKPPPFGSYVSVSTVETGWGQSAGRYALDFREPGAETSWDLLVESNVANSNVTLSWPDVALVPSNVALVLTDLGTGRRRMLRTTSSYSFQLPATGQRLFRLTANRSDGTSLAITDLSLRQTRGGGSVSYGLSAAAEVTVNLCSSTGRTIRTLVAAQAATRGTNEVAWAATDGQGRPLPNGLYRLDLIATDADGRQVRTSRLVRVER